MRAFHGQSRQEFRSFELVHQVGVKLAKAESKNQIGEDIARARPDLVVYVASASLHPEMRSNVKLPDRLCQTRRHT